MKTEIKIDFELTKDEMSAIVEARIRKGILEQANAWNFDEQIKSAIKKQWMAAIDETIASELAKIDSIKQKVIAEIEAKLKRNINKLMETK